MTSLPTDTTDKTAIDAEVMETAKEVFDCLDTPGEDYIVKSEIESDIRIIARAIQAAKAEGDHFLRHFTKLAKVNPAANAALDTARREWAKKGEK